MERTSTRIPSLDGLRTISIALVIVGHFLHVIGLGEKSNLGNLGVRVFFVISGFLITGILVREVEKTSTISLLKFYFRRSMRIFPPYYFYLLVLLVVGLVGTDQIELWSVLKAAVYSTDYLAPQGWLLGHTWSLAVEEQFYILLPFTLLLLGVKNAKRALLLLILISPMIRLADFMISGDEQIWVLKGFHANIDALGVGCLLTLYRSKLENSRAFLRPSMGWIVGAFTAIILLINIQGDHPKFFYTLGISAMNIMIACCIFWCVSNHRTPVGRLLNSPPLVQIGVMSYSIYLWQQPFFDPRSGLWFTATPFNFIGLAVATCVSYYAIERFSLKLRQKWERRLFDDGEPVVKAEGLPAGVRQPIESAS